MDGEDVRGGLGGGLGGGVKVGAVILKEFKVRIACFLEQFDGAFQEFYVILLD